MPTKRSIILTAILLLLICLSSGKLSAGEISTKDGKTTLRITVFNLPQSSDPQVNIQADVAVYKEFIRQFPDIFKKRLKKKFSANPEKYGKHDWDNVQVELEPFSGIEVEGVESDLLAIAGGVAPDILFVNFRKSNNYIMNNFLYPLDEYFAELTPKQIDFRINKKIWPVIKRKGSNKEEHIWSIPYGGSLGKVLLFRRDLFDAAGVPYPTNHWTWSDMLSAAKKMTNPSKGIYGLALGSGKHESWFWVTFLWSAGGDVMKYDKENNQWSCVFDSPAGVEALHFYNRISNEKWFDENGKPHRGYAVKDTQIINDKWERGEVAMSFNYVDEKLLATIDPEITGMVPVPIGPTGMRGGELNCRMYGLFSQIKEPAVRDAAWEYLRFITSIQAERIRTKIMVEGGMGRFLNPKYLRMFGYTEVEKLSPRGWAETFKIAIETGIPEPYGTNSNVAYDMMTVPIQKIASLSLTDQLPKDEVARKEVIAKVLEESCDRANEVMIGKITADEKTKRRIIAIVMLVVILATFILIFHRIIKAFTPKDLTGLQKGWQFGKYIWAYVLLIPAIVAIFVWQYVPLLRGSIMAFYDYKLLGDSVFVGVDNFGNLFFDSVWWSSVYNALRYSLLVMALTFIPPIILAILLQEVPRGKILFRTIYYLPAVITGVVITLLWKQFYEPSELGALNSIVMNIPAIGFILMGVLLFAICYVFARRLWLHENNISAWCFVISGVLLFITVAGFAMPILQHPTETLTQALPLMPSRLLQYVQEPFRWLLNPDTAMTSCVIPMVWAGMGPGCLIYLAALKGIPDDFYEAADIDGASFIDKIIFVVFPNLKSLIIINFVGAFIQSWYNATANIMVMTAGGANTEVAGLHIWYKAFTFLQFGPATAMAWMLGFILIGFTVNQLRILSRVEFKAQGSNV